MGRGSYTSSDWSRLKSNRNINSDSKLSDLYTQRQMKEGLNPYGVKYRESCDSIDSPASTAIIIGLDVTGSMGYLSEEIAKNSLNKTMTEIYEKKPVTGPHIMFQAIGDSKSDEAPLQVTQFEADIRIVEQLLDIYFEGGGGGNGGESYLLSWYFAARHTKIDCFNKRHKKGFIITIGDEACHLELTPREVERVFGEKVSRSLSAKELYMEASKMYEIFHIVIKAGSSGYQKSPEAWKKLIGNHAIELDPENLDKLPEIFISLMQAAGGMPAKEIAKQWDKNVSAIVINAIGGYLPDAKKGMLNF